MLQCEELKDEEGPSNTLEQFTELEQILGMIDTMKACDAPGFERDYQQYTELLSRYQEQPHLLDPQLDVLLQRLLAIVRNKALPEGLIHSAFKYMYIISKVRTYKVLVKFLPHELSDLEFALEMLERQNPKECNHWETRYMLLLWMSILVLNPFHMSRLDAYTITSNESAPANNCVDSAKLMNPTQNKSKMERIFDLCRLYTSTSDTCSDIAAYLAAKYLVRADIKEVYLERYLDWVISQHQLETSDAKFGELAAISAILKHGKREDLIPYVDKLLKWVVGLQYKDSNDFLKYKSYIKIVQRIGLVYLKPRLAGWRYKRGTRSLAMNLNKTNSAATDERASGNDQDPEGEGGDGEEIVVPDAIEEVIEELLQALRSGGSDIRWSAAKGVGRVTNRLSKELADEVIGSVIDILNPLEPHEAWHGACLALAELAKRGLLLPHRLRTLVPLLMQALFYDEMKGYMSVGQHIRDSACYMCWAFARAYNPADFQPFVEQISSGLLTVAVFDREINCRRAAAAAFQESVGRLGNFPHGIEICTATDFFSVGMRQNSYLKVSDFIAQFEEYQKPLIDHLVEKKVNHWDTTIRELAAKALYNLTFRAPEYMSAVVLGQLFGKTESIDINMRHGTVMAIGEITLALSEIEQKEEGIASKKLLTNQLLSELNELLPTYVLRDSFRGMSGEIMKHCCTDFIKNCSMARIETSKMCLECWQYIVDKCLLNKALAIREGATDAFAELCRSYYKGDEHAATNAEIIHGYLKGANNHLEEYIRMGYISALGALPDFMIAPHLDDILESLIKHSLTPTQAVITTGEMLNQHENLVTGTWSESRRDSVKALSHVVHTLGFDKNTEVSFGNPKYFNKVVDCFLQSLDEYTLDNRGDIGAWVREAAMNALFQLITTCPKELLQPEQVHKIILGFMQQAVEKIDRTRGLAGRLFCQIITTTPHIPHIRHHARLLEVFPADFNSVLWLFADQTFPLFCSLLELPDYSQRLLLGLSASIGQLTESLIKHSSAALFEFLRTHPAEVPRLCKEVVANFQDNVMNERVTYPMLNFLEILISSGSINVVLLDEENTFGEDIYRLLNLETKGHKKLYKLISSISVYCQLVQVPYLCKRILSKMAIFLGLTHVHVRKTSATKFYEALALHGDACDIPEENMDEILNLLSETDWGLPLIAVRPIRNQLCELMGIKPPVSGAAVANSDTAGVAEVGAGVSAAVRIPK
ncbi:tubulin-specific chaperone D-like [Rhagoletis pomonella]|uniref:tubulin-specific chaperone D-like n=1 Tax=Rhagoletis pomonella TaxID=28610 RepID=UPI00177F636B|nr:tubulin-specific chaperone D-like [Rhagoletis pomonella]